MIRLEVRVEHWPITGRFTIARGVKTEAHVVVAEIGDDAHTGRGECVPYARYGESVDGVVATIEGAAPAIGNGLDRAGLQTLLPPGAARNALDCALWDLEAKTTGVPVWRRAGLGAPKPQTTAFTLSLDRPDAMADAARAAKGYPLLKLKLGPDGAVERVAAVTHAAPHAKIIVDANEAWSLADLTAYGPALARLGVGLIEQPLPADADHALAGFSAPVPLCADESLHDRASLDEVARRYQFINIKLDKTGGLTEALALAKEARARGLSIMVGCMVATSLAMAPAFLLAPFAQVIDLDGPLLLARDRQDGFAYHGAIMAPPASALWG